MGVSVTGLLSRRTQNKHCHMQTMPRKDFARSRQNTYCQLDSNNTEKTAMALPDLDLTSDLISYYSQHSKHGRQEGMGKRRLTGRVKGMALKGFNSILKEMGNRQGSLHRAATRPRLYSGRCPKCYVGTGREAERKGSRETTEEKTQRVDGVPDVSEEGLVNGSGVKAIRPMSSAWSRITLQGLPSGARESGSKEEGGA